MVNQNATRDCIIGEQMQAKIRLAVKRILKKYGYLTGAKSLTVLRVMETAKAIAAEPSLY